MQLASELEIYQLNKCLIYFYTNVRIIYLLFIKLPLKMKFILMLTVFCVGAFPKGISGGILDEATAALEDVYCRQKYENSFIISICRFSLAGGRRFGIEPGVFLFIFLLIVSILIIAISKYLCCPRKKHIIVYTSRSPQ
ncbi:uncharacterized protein LOC116337767 [Contarinia nasturtii]|uniref:uncharacterized protein LOC116337767 n=1 Tax=Contarinia nasturtii TaxID=265458 RepID=UPI0012D3A262|nr:uncharacterized protein LOC116337767 [Contarinia nasturtii]